MTIRREHTRRALGARLCPVCGTSRSGEISDSCTVFDCARFAALRLVLSHTLLHQRLSR